MGTVTLQDWIRNTVFWNVFDHQKSIVVETKAFNFVPANASCPALLIQRIVWYCAYRRCYLPAPSVPCFPLLVVQATTLGTTLCFGQLVSCWGGHEGDCAAGGRERNFPSFILFTLPGGQVLRGLSLCCNSQLLSSASPHAPGTSLQSVWESSGSRECPRCGSELQILEASPPSSWGTSSGTWVPDLWDNFQFW